MGAHSRDYDVFLPGGQTLDSGKDFVYLFLSQVAAGRPDEVFSGAISGLYICLTIRIRFVYIYLPS